MEILGVPADVVADLVGALFVRLVTKSVITHVEADAILDDAVALITGQGDTVSTSDALVIIEDIRARLGAHGC